MESLYLFKFKGVRVELHWLSVLFLLIASLGGAVYFLIWLIVLLSVLLHEIAHSYLAVRYRLSVKKILIVLPFGGGTIIDSSYKRPYIEFNVTFIGPLTNLLLGSIFGLLATISASPIVTYLLQTGFIINILLAVLNLIPWFPLDGGRLLRSYLEKKDGYLKATRKAVFVSNIFSFIMFLGVFVYTFFFNSYSLLYKEILFIIDLVVIYFIYTSAKIELYYAELKEISKKLKVRDVIQHSYILIDKNASLNRLLSEILKRHTRVVIYKENESYYLVTDLTRLNNRHKHISDLPRVEILTMQYNKWLSEYIDRIRSSDVNIIGIVNKKGKLVGITDINHIEAVLRLHKHAAR
ncbi:MAG: zinc metalloprotease [Candidatus Micrarchaeota archaeon]|nr:MAG: zinc metalloprotease [Candidatus Micrarchaeota archaeon]